MFINKFLLFFIIAIILRLEKEVKCSQCKYEGQKHDNGHMWKSSDGGECTVCECVSGQNVCKLRIKCSEMRCYSGNDFQACCDKMKCPGIFNLIKQCPLYYQQIFINILCITILVVVF